MRRQFLADCVKQATAVTLVVGASSWLTGCGGESAPESARGGSGPGATGSSGAATGSSGAATGSSGAATGSSGAATGSSGAATGSTPADSGATRFTFADNPALQNVGGAIMTKVGSTPIAVVRTGATTAVVLNATCPHQGCTVGAYDNSAQTFTCPCHGSVYGEAGDLKMGPSTRALTSYPATVNSADISATIS